VLFIIRGALEDFYCIQRYLKFFNFAAAAIASAIVRLELNTILDLSEAE
jgi:hypothetical protein